jgi:hypothetical protein
MVTPIASQGRLEIPAVLIASCRRYAEFCADRLADVLRGSFTLRADEPIELPAGFLLDFAAVVQLASWERQGLPAHLHVELPTAQKAAETLVGLAQHGPAAFAVPDGIPLYQQVLGVWIEHFAWDGQQLLGCDVLVGAVDEEQFAAVLAEFLLEHQHELSQLLPQIKELP